MEEEEDGVGMEWTVGCKVAVEQKGVHSGAGMEWSGHGWRGESDGGSDGQRGCAGQVDGVIMS